MGGFFDERVSDERLCSRVWTMFVRCGFAPGAHVAEIDDDDNQEEDEMGGKRVTDEERAEILRRHGEGEQFKDIATALERHPTFVSGIVKAAGGAPAPTKAKAAPRAKPEAKPVARKVVRRAEGGKPASVVSSSPIEVMRAERDRLRTAADAIDTALEVLDPTGSA